MNFQMPDAFAISKMQDETTLAWHEPSHQPETPSENLMALIRTQHRANFDLWHEEDKARDPHATDRGIAEIKRAIDLLNQHRNDLVEQIDTKILAGLEEAAGPNPTAPPLHSETPGMMIDRLSILALKVFHTREEASRDTATNSHRQRNRERLDLLCEQRGDLAQALDMFFKDLTGGRRRFKLYRQMKMYNDPDLNPAIYKHKS